MFGRLGILFLAGCAPANISQQTYAPAEKKIDGPESKQLTSHGDQTASSPDDPINIILDGLFMGTYENGQWNSNQQLKNTNYGNNLKDLNRVGVLRRVPLDELNKKQLYTLFTQNSKIAETEDFKANVPGGALYYVRYTFNTNGKENTNVPLAFTAEYNPLPLKIMINEAVQDKHKAAVRRFLDTNGLNNTEVNISQDVSVDIDGDGTLEDLIIAQTPRNVSGYPQLNPDDRFKDGTGVYAVAIIEKGDSYVPVYYEGRKLEELKFTSAKILPFGIESSFTLTLLGIFDLNGDSKYEVILRNIEWDCPEISVYESQKNNEWNEVLYGDFSW